MDLGNITESCKTNTAGTGVVLKWAPVSYFDAIAKATAASAAATADEIVKITTAHTFLTGKGFHNLEVVMNTGGVESNSVGEIAGKSFEHMAKGFVSNNDPLNLGLLTKLASCKYILLVPEITEDGTVYRQIGNEDRPGYCEDNSYNSGTAAADRRGTTVSFKSDGNATHAPFYSGTITMHP